MYSEYIILCDIDRDGEKFAELLLTIRSELKLSQQQLADALVVSFATVNRWENCRTTPTKVHRLRVKPFCEKKGIVVNL